MYIAQWYSDLKWLMLIWKIKRFRNKLPFDKRILFDEALRPHVINENRLNNVCYSVIDYPEAFYYIKIENFKQAKTYITQRPFYCDSLGILKDERCIVQEKYASK